MLILRKNNSQNRAIKRYFPAGKRPLIGKKIPFIYILVPFIGRVVGRIKPSISKQQQHSGFTIIELMIVLVVLSIMLAIALPAMFDLMQRNRLVSQTNDMIADINLTRTTGLTTGMDITMCASADGADCGGGSWNNGWIVFYDCNGDGTLDDSTNVCPNIDGLNQIPEQLIKYRNTTHDHITVTETQSSGTANKLRFSGSGVLQGVNDHILKVCAEELEDGRRITVNVAGRPGVSVWLSSETNPCG